MRPGKTAIIHFVSQTVVSVAGFLATFFIAVLLGAEGLGEYSIAVALGSFWLVIPGNAIGMAIEKRMSEGISPGEYFGAGVVLNLGVAAAIAVLVVGAGVLLQAIESPDRTFVRVLVTYNSEIALLAVATIAIKTIFSGLRGQKRVARAAMFKALERGTRTGLQIAVILAGFAVAAITLGHVASLVIVAVLGVVLSPVRPSVPTVANLRSLLSYASYAWMSTLSGRVFGWLDTIVLSFFVSASLIGIYEAAWGLASLLAMASASIRQTLFPEISEISASDQYDEVKHLLDEALAFSGLFVIPGLFGVLVLGDRILRFYRPEFTQGTGILVILVLAYLADVYGSQIISTINAIDRPDTAFRVNLAFILLNVVLNVVLVWRFGWYGAAVGTAASSGLRTLFGYRALAGIVGPLRLPVGVIGYEALASLLMAGLLLAMRSMVPSGRVGTLVLVGTGALVYTVALFGLSSRVREKALSLAPAGI